MRSFGIFSAVAAVACSILASAAPLDVVAAGTGVAAVHARSPVALDVPVVEARESISIVEILIGLKAKIEPACEQLNAFSAADVKVEVVVDVLAEIVAEVKVAIVGCNGLIGADVAVILGGVDVALSVVAGLLAEILCLVLVALANILLYVKVEVLGAVFVEVGVVLGSLTGCCCSLLGGLLELLLPLIVSIVASIELCGFASLLAVLNIAV